jgi:membrane protease subunit (stomatin/prohibitin family)|nr:SPFH domain-containing protein [uncultured Flavobacterium sp.]
MEVLEFIDNSGSVLVRRIPENGNLEIKWGSQLTVRESQDAIFFRDGKALDVFGAGRHILKTQNIPVVGKWVTSFGYGPDSPFRAEVVFIGKQLFPNLKWGTKEPILFRDTELQMIRLRSYGSFSIQVQDSMLFVNKVVGTMGLYTTGVIEDYLRGIIISKLNVVLGKMLKSVFDIPVMMDDLNMVFRTELQQDFAGLGLTLHDLYIQSISVPEEVQGMIDTKSGMNAMGNLDQYMKLKVANSLGDAAKNNGIAGAGLGLGAGLGMGMAMPNMIQQAMQSNSSESVTDKLKSLKELLDLGALTQDEFDIKKKELLKQI